MYINKNELIRRLISITGKHRAEFQTLTVAELSSLYEQYAGLEPRRYINVPYRDKNLAKLLGARYDGEKQKWYIPEGVDAKLFIQWAEEQR